MIKLLQKQNGAVFYASQCGSCCIRRRRRCYCIRMGVKLIALTWCEVVSNKYKWPIVYLPKVSLKLTTQTVAVVRTDGLVSWRVLSSTKTSCVTFPRRPASSWKQDLTRRRVSLSLHFIVYDASHVTGTVSSAVRRVRLPASWYNAIASSPCCFLRIHLTNLWDLHTPIHNYVQNKKWNIIPNCLVI